MNQGPGAGPGTGPGGRPGQMTAVMRAMAVNTGPKVLRIGVVHRGRIVEERVIKQRTTVTVGQSEKSMFVVPSPNIPPQFKLFELLGPDYYLNFLDGMTGRVALATGITDIGALRGQAKKNASGAYQVKLTEEARGKVVIGDTTFLFQFVAPPPVQPRPQLPLAVKGGLASQIDWTLTIIAAFSFLLHFGIVGAMYSDWMDQPVGDDSVAGLADMLKNIPAPPAPEVPPEPTAAPTTTSQATKDPAKAAAPTGPAAKQNGPVSDTKAAALSQQADQMQMAMLASIAGGPSTKGALDRSEIPPVDLSNAAASTAGVTPGAGDLKFGAGGAPVQGGRNGGLGAIAGGTTGSGTGSTAGNERKVAGPTGDAQVGAFSASVQVSDADRVIAGLRPKFKACYQQGLNSDPTMSGKVTISAKIAPTGEVDSANATENTGLSAGVASCIARAVRNAQFAAPGGTGSALKIPVTFVQQK